MTKILTDIFSVFTFSKIYDEKPKNFDFRKYENIFHLIENFILCDQLILEENGIKHYGLSSFCDQFVDAIGYVQYPYLYPLSLNNHDASYEERIVGNIEKRGKLYLQLAQQYDLFFSPHPIRQSVLGNIVKAKENTATKIISHFDQRICATEAGDFSNINLKIPPVIEHVLSFAKKNHSTLSQSIIEIRNTKNAILFRKYCSNLDNELRELSPRKKVAIYQVLFKDIDVLCNSWKDDLNEYVTYQQRSVNLSKIPILGKVAEFFGINNLEIKDPVIIQDKPHFLFINDLYAAGPTNHKFR